MSEVQEEAKPKRKWNVLLTFKASVVVEAATLQEARKVAEDMVNSRSVYEDDKVEQLVADAHKAGAEGEDSPLRYKWADAFSDSEFDADSEVLLEHCAGKTLPCLEIEED